MKIISKLLSDIIVFKPDIKVINESEDILIKQNRSVNLGITTKFVQDNESHSNKNVLRGLHYQIQHPQGKLIHVVSGMVFDVVVDLRKSSEYFGKVTSFILSAENGLLAWIPPGHAHGFYVIGDHAKMLYSVTDYRFPEFERTLLWSDPELGINWPLKGTPIISDTDAAGQLFRDIEVYN